MKEEILLRLRQFKSDLTKLRKEVNSLQGQTVSRNAIRQLADKIATDWVEELRSPLEHKLKLPNEVIQGTSEQMKRLHVLSWTLSKRSTQKGMSRVKKAVSGAKARHFSDFAIKV